MRNAERMAADRQKITDGGVLDILLDHIRGIARSLHPRSRPHSVCSRKSFPTSPTALRRATTKGTSRTALPQLPNSRFTLSIQMGLDVARAFKPLLVPKR
jgi:hypothetical protein